MAELQLDTLLEATLFGAGRSMSVVNFVNLSVMMRMRCWIVCIHYVQL